MRTSWGWVKYEFNGPICLSTGAAGTTGEFIMTKRQPRKKKQRKARIDDNGLADLAYTVTHSKVSGGGSGGSDGSGRGVNGLYATDATWYPDTSKEGTGPRIAGIYAIFHHDGRGIVGRLIQTFHARNQMISHFEDMTGEHIGLHCIKSVYGPIPEENNNG